MASSRNDSSTSLKQQHDLADTASSPEAKKPRLREPKVKWTVEEDAQLAAGVKKYGTDTKAWNQIADTFNGTRDVKRCRERWQEYIDPSLSHVAFTDAEDTAILACQRHFGNQWKMIAEVMSKQHEHRSATAIKSRWHQLQKREKRMNKYAERLKSVRRQCGMQDTHKSTSTVSNLTVSTNDHSGNDVKEVSVNDAKDAAVNLEHDATVIMHKSQQNADCSDTPTTMPSHERWESTSSSQLQPALESLNFSKIPPAVDDIHVINNCITAHISSPRPLTAPMMQFTAAYERHMNAIDHRMQYPMMGYPSHFSPAHVLAPPTIGQCPPIYGNQYYDYNTMQHPLAPPTPQYLPHPVPFMQYPLQQEYCDNNADEDDDFLVQRYFQEHYFEDV